ncbi:dienelactone hydrolase family protein [Mycobacterium aquaticum]|uniref:SnoaL-like domain-containing protein n=1 Tax=Mycobacterium aquaticum TaxID=1927124 RepID=A0A1X0A8G1_9MYCO|nr:dienelactone hydrolase family protein [Mycobacterium aquaticum]ORA26294.1 hypothetical protein BST13_32055 [Mycobacterium aquaticum]
MHEELIELATSDGVMATFVCQPERGGPHPAVIMFMDAYGIRDELRDMARRLASSGYYVALPNLYYRAGVVDVHADDCAGLAATLSRPHVAADTAAVMGFLDAQAAVRGPYGTVGYCMSGQYAVNAAHWFPAKVAAAASFHGTGFTTDEADSWHLLGKATDAELYFGFAEQDRYMSLDMVADFRRELDRAGARAEVEIYPGTRHGFVFAGRSVYHARGADRHWERLHALLNRCLARPTGEEMIVTTTDEEAIRRLCGQYCHYLDGTGGAQDIDALLALFTDDAWLYSARQGVYFPGREQLRAFFQGYSGTKGKSKHLSDNAVITIAGDTASAVSDWMYLRQVAQDGAEVLTVAAYGRFHDELVRVSGEWRIQSRRITKGNEAPVAPHPA